MMIQRFNLYSMVYAVGLILVKMPISVLATTRFERNAWSLGSNLMSLHGGGGELGKTVAMHPRRLSD